MLTCLFTGILATLQVYAAQLIWPDTAVSRRRYGVRARGGTRGRAGLFQVVNVDPAGGHHRIGHGRATGRGARLLYGMGRDGAMPRGFFGAIDPRARISRATTCCSSAPVAGRSVHS